MASQDQRLWTYHEVDTHIIYCKGENFPGAGHQSVLMPASDKVAREFGSERGARGPRYSALPLLLAAEPQEFLAGGAGGRGKLMGLV